MSYHSFEDLEVWQMASNLAVRIYKVLTNCRDYGLKDQMTRSAVSVASNIAEGAERGSHADFVRFLHIAKGSVAELRTQIHIAVRINAISSRDAEELSEDLKLISKKLHALIKHLKSKT